MAFDPNDLIYPMTFVYVNTDKFEGEEAGIKKGDIVFVAGTRSLPLTEDDPYTTRVFIYVQPVVDDYIDNDRGFYILDPVSVTNLPPEDNERLLALAQERVDATTH